ncbi:MAG: hypothetical protein U0441_06750 [Polyangiaceae bacterium]
MNPPAPKAALPPETAPGTARWLNMVTTMVLGAAALMVGVVSIPSLLRAVAGNASAQQEFAPPVRAHNPAIVSGEHGSHPFEVEDDDAPPPRRPLELPLNDPRARAPRFPGDRGGQVNLDDDDDAPSPEDLGGKVAVTKKVVPVRDRRTNSVLSEIAPGSRVQILREDGDWILLMQGSGSNVTAGWVKRSELLLR